jgi:hypothetical protein
MPTPFQTYPKVMKHPDYAPPVIEKEDGPDKGLFRAGARQIASARFPDVTVSNVNDEKAYAAKGYRPANMGNPEEYEKAILDGAVHANVTITEYPKWKYHDENIPKIVNDKDEEKALGPGWRDTPDAIIAEVLASFQAVQTKEKIDRRKKEHRNKA